VHVVVAKKSPPLTPVIPLLLPQKLEEQNPQFFQAYYTRLKLKDQIVLFNHLLDQQVNIVHHCQNAWRAQQAQLAAQAQAAAAQQQGGQPPGGLANMPGMQPAASLPSSMPAAAAGGAAAPSSEPVPASAAAPAADSGAYSGSDLRPGGLQTPDLGDLGDMQVSLVERPAAAAATLDFLGHREGECELLRLSLPTSSERHGGQ